MIKNITITTIITNEMERPMISLFLYLFSSLLLSPKVALTSSSISLSAVGMGVAVFMGLMLTGGGLTPTFTIAGVWIIGACDIEVGVTNWLIEACVDVEVGAILFGATIEQNNEYW